MSFVEDDVETMLSDTDGFGTLGIWTHTVDSEEVETEVRGIFDDAFTGLSAYTGQVETSSPQFSVASADVVGIEHGDTITINSQIYTVKGLQPDGTGLTVIILKS